MSIFWLSLLACGDKNTVQDSGITEDINTEPQAPVEPSPFTLTVSGDHNLTLTFDSPTCQIPEAAPNLNTFWRTSTGAHTFVLRVMLRGDYEGAGTYTLQDNELTVTLQEEAGGEGRYFSVNLDDGHEATVELNTEGRDIVWGTLSASQLASISDGSISISPTSIPLWCDADNTN